MVQQHDERSTDERGDGIQLALQHLGHPPRQDVAEEAAPDGRDAADEGRRQRPGVVVQGDQRAAHREHAESRRVEHPDGRRHPAPARVGVAPCELLPPSVEEEHEQPGDDRGREEPPVADTDRRRDAEEEVAQDAPTEARDPGEDEDPEEVQTDPHGDERTGQREDEDPDEVEAELERGGVRQHRSILAATRCAARTPPEGGPEAQ